MLNRTKLIDKIFDEYCDRCPYYSCCGCPVDDYIKVITQLNAPKINGIPYIDELDLLNTTHHEFCGNCLGDRNDTCKFCEIQIIEKLLDIDFYQSEAKNE